MQSFRYREISGSCPEVLFHHVHNLKLYKIRYKMHALLSIHFYHKKQKYFSMVLLNYINRFQQYQRRRFYENVTMSFISLLSYPCPQKDKSTKVFNQIARLFFLDFNQIWILSTDFNKSTQVQFWRKFFQWEPRVCTWTDRGADLHKLICALNKYAKNPG